MRMHICSSLGESFNHCYDQQDDMVLNQWYKLRIQQTQKDLQIDGGVIWGVVHVYEIWINDVKVRLLMMR